MEVEEALSHLGKYGLWQMGQLIWVGIFVYVAVPFSFLSIVFQGWIPPHTCALPANALKNESIPSILKDGKLVYEQCYQYEIVGNVTLSNTVKCQNGYEFDRGNYYTFTEEFSWVCDAKYMNLLAKIMFYIGTLFGSIIFSAWSDATGRKYSVIVPGLLAALTHGLGTIPGQPVLFIVLRGFTGVFAMGAFNVGFVLAYESFPASQGPFVAAFVFVMWSIGLLLNGLFAYLLHDWRHLQFLGAAKCALIILDICLLDESVQWLVCKSRGIEAAEILRKAARRNKVEIPEHLLKFIEASEPCGSKPTNPGNQTCQDLENGSPPTTDEKDSSRATKMKKKLQDIKDALYTRRDACPQNYKITVLDVLRNPKLRIRILLSPVIWFATAFMYFGMVLTTPLMRGGRFLNYFIGAAVEIPGYIFSYYALNHYGRRPVLGTLLTVAGIMLIASTFIPSQVGTTDLLPLVMTLNSIGRFAVVAPYAGAFVYAHEVWWLPGVIMGSAGFIATAALLPLPETKDEHGQQKIDDVTTLVENEEMETVEPDDKSKP
ncbi:organic cation transporter protein-like [Tubulanus polymorphus]|uniref:organic cation transporter protein-like n=1 Tax=Tubulanus polymorphus TaxID=672921 RepID=UPI003DA2174C